jgi:hypothetical protein
MSDIKKKWAHGGRAACIVISGSCVGYLAGLSVSPVAGVVLSGVVAVVVALTSALAGLGTEIPSSEATAKSPVRRTPMAVNPVPVTLLLLGIVAGSTTGIWSRTHDWLGTLKPGGTVGASETAKKASAGVLYRAEATECSDWRGMNDVTALRENMGQSKSVTSQPGASAAVKKCATLECLGGVIEVLCQR